MPCVDVGTARSAVGAVDVTVGIATAGDGIAIEVEVSLRGVAAAALDRIATAAAVSWPDVAEADSIFAAAAVVASSL